MIVIRRLVFKYWVEPVKTREAPPDDIADCSKSVDCEASHPLHLTYIEQMLLRLCNHRHLVLPE